MAVTIYYWFLRLVVTIILVFPFTVAIKLVFVLRMWSLKSSSITQKVNLSKAKCLKKALIIVLVAHQRPTVYFGVKKGEFGMEAHAWTKVGDRFLTGWEGHEDFKVIATFD